MTFSTIIPFELGPRSDKDNRNFGLKSFLRREENGGMSTRSEKYPPKLNDSELLKCYILDHAGILFLSHLPPNTVMQ